MVLVLAAFNHSILPKLVTHQRPVVVTNFWCFHSLAFKIKPPRLSILQRDASRPKLAQTCLQTVIEPLRLEKTSKISLSNLWPTPPSHAAKCQVCSFSEHFQGWWLNHCPGQPVPMLNHSYSEEILPNIQLEPPLVQFEAISLYPIPSSLREEADPHLTTNSWGKQDSDAKLNSSGQVLVYHIGPLATEQKLF